MENYGDFIDCLGPDMSSKILMCLDDPSDLVRATAVSRSWQKFVVEKGLAKQLCVKLFPDLSSFIESIEVKNIIEPVADRSRETLSWEYLKRNHRVYACVARGLEPSGKSCILEAIVASSTDNYPEESIENTLEPRDRVENNNASYWSSKGEDDPTVPETLVYRLAADLCVISEICVRPFQAYFQYGFPVYSPKAVRFRMGHPKSSTEIETLMRGEYMVGMRYANDYFVWTYTSPEFPMVQENSLQRFSLPEPVLCIGGILQVELLGRVQRQEMDGLYYICISHVESVGRILSPSFEVNVMDLSGRCTLEYCPQPDQNSSETQFEDANSSGPSNLGALSMRLMRNRIRGWEEMILNTLLGTGDAVVDDDDKEDDSGSDDDDKEDDSGSDDDDKEDDSGSDYEDKKNEEQQHDVEVMDGDSGNEL